MQLNLGLGFKNSGEPGGKWTLMWKRGMGRVLPGFVPGDPLLFRHLGFRV